MKRYQALVILPLIFLMACQPDNGSIRPNVNHDGEYIKPDKKAAELNTQLGLSYLQRGEYETALDKLEKALKQDPNSSSAHHTIAILYDNLGEVEQAEYHYRRAVDIAPKYSQAQNNYGVFLCKQGKYGDSIERFLIAIENPLYRNPDQAYENAGLCAQQIPDVAMAEQYLRTALQMNPRLGKALLGMAEISYQQGDYATSQTYIDRYRTVAQWTPNALLQAIRTARRMNDENAVASYIVLLRGRFPDSDQAKQISGGY